MLPMDVHLLIRDELLKHTDTTFAHFKAYRTVCKTFDDVWSPVVLSSVSLFPLLHWPTNGNNIHAQFRYLIDGPERFASTRTISIKNWHCLNSDFSLTEAIRQAWKSSAVEGVMTTLALLILAPPVELVKFLIRPLDVPDRARKLWWTYQARRCATLLPQRLNLPNVRCARLFFRDSETKWVISRATRALLALPKLTELELCISGDANTPYMSECLTQITSLRKFTLRAYAVSAKSYATFYPDIESFRAVLARNPNLTHLSLLTAYEKQSDLSELLRDIPADRPLKLEYLALSNNYSPCEALLPHIRTLKSFSFCATHDIESWCQFFTQASIFPPTIKVNFITDELFTYLSRHPGLVSLSVGDGRLGSLSLLSKTLAHHSRTLCSLLITSQSLAIMLVVTADQDNFRKCTNLQELVLYHHDVVGEVRHEKHILTEVGRLGNSLVLVLTHKWVYSQCVRYCLKSFSFDERDLAERIIYERRQDLE